MDSGRDLAVSTAGSWLHNSKHKSGFSLTTLSVDRNNDAVKALSSPAGSLCCTFTVGSHFSLE